MTIPASSAPAARLWLFQQCQAQITEDQNIVLPDGYIGDGSASLLVCLDEPGTHQPADIVSIGKVSRQIGVSSLVGSGGAGWLDERYGITVEIEAARGGDDPQSAFERVCSLVDQVCAVVRTDPTLGGNVLWSRPTSVETEVRWQDDHMGRVGIAELTIECYQRI